MASRESARVAQRRPCRGTDRNRPLATDVQGAGTR
jgi:hypothetical protein